MNSKPTLPKRFYRHHLISKAEKNYSSEFDSVLYCAWLCDDADDELSVEMRKLALKSIDKIITKDDNERGKFEAYQGRLA